MAMQRTDRQRGGRACSWVHESTDLHSVLLLCAANYCIYPRCNYLPVVVGKKPMKKKKLFIDSLVELLYWVWLEPIKVIHVYWLGICSIQPAIRRLRDGSHFEEERKQQIIFCCDLIELIKVVSGILMQKASRLWSKSSFNGLINPT